MNQEKVKLTLSLTGFLAVLGFIGACFLGYVLNILALIDMGLGEVSAMFILRIVGIFAAPLGTLLGWFA